VVIVTATWSIATFAAMGAAWLAVSHAVANVADPVPSIISGSIAAPRAAPLGAGSVTTTTDTAPPAGATELSPSTAPSVPSSSQLTEAGPPATTGIGEPAAVGGNNAPSTVAPVVNTASFSRAGGVVTMSCRGEAASLVSATPNQGYTVLVSNPGPEAVEVTFSSSSNDSEFHGHCVNGQPAPELSDD